MGQVYKATDLLLGQTVALKFLPQSLAANSAAAERFRNEVRLARQVSHPNVCRVYDMGEAEGELFLTMEYVDGKDLASLLRRIGRLPADKATEIARRLCAGLAAAHEKGVLHRDFKPANIMIDGRGQVRITDFGLALLAGSAGGEKTRGVTPGYMAPEQIDGQAASERSDIYALGLVLFEMFAGKRPFEAPDLAAIHARQKQGAPSISASVRDLDPAVDRAIARCLDPEPLKRPKSALAVAAALPSGDPQAAALEAGETPSPEMVARAFYLIEKEGAGQVVLAAGQAHGREPQPGSTPSRTKTSRPCSITSTWLCPPSHRRESRRHRRLRSLQNRPSRSLRCGEDLRVAPTDSETLSHLETREVRKFG